MKLKEDFEKYKQQKYNEFATIKDKLNSHDDMVTNFNKEIRKLEESLKLEHAKVSQYVGSIKDLNARIKTLEAQQVAMPAPSVAQQQPSPSTTSNSKPDLIEDDWENIRKALDFVLSLDKKEASRAGFNVPALKLTRQLIK